MEINFFGKKIVLGVGDVTDEVVMENVGEENTLKSDIREDIVLDRSGEGILGNSEVVGISESIVHKSPSDIRKMIDSNEIKMSSLLDSMTVDYSIEEVYKENEDMSKDTIIGSAMELMADDCCMVNPSFNRIVKVSSSNKGLEDFLNTFLEKNINIDSRVWEWAFEIVKHGDLKLRRMEYETPGKGKNVFYENVQESYKVSRLEYLGNVLGYLDEESEEKKETGKPVLEPSDSFVHFLSTKLSNRKKVKIKVKDKDNKIREVNCYKVYGSSLVDNARYIYRVVNLLDNMLIMSRVARSTQYNIIKVEVGNASPNKTQEILMDVRRRIEGSTKLSKGRGIRSDPSPIPVNSNVYVPVREGKGDIQVDSVNESIDVKSIVDIDYFKNKLFATLRVPQAYMGFEECLHYDTIIPLLDGSYYKIGDMAKNPGMFVGKGILSCNEDGTIVPTKIVHVKVTRKNATFVRVNLDNGEYVDCTPDHLIMMRNGEFKEAGSLTSGESLMPYYERLGRDGHKEVVNNKGRGSWVVLHRHIMENVLGENIPKGLCVHHVNEVKVDNEIVNLELLTAKEHARKHWKNVERWYLKGREASRGRDTSFMKEDWYREKISKALRGRKLSKEHSERISKALKGKESNNPFKPGIDNIMCCDEVRVKQKESLREYYDNGGTTWQKSSNDLEKIAEWKDIIAKARWEGKKTSRVCDLVCSECGESFNRKLGNKEIGREVNRFCCVGHQRKFQARKNLEKINGTNVISVVSGESYINHKVVSVEVLDIVEDAYDLGVENESHSFPTVAGIFVHNSLPGTMGNSSLLKLDLRYARNVQKAQNILRNGIVELCNNYLRYRGRGVDVGNFNIILKSVTSAEDASRLEDFVSQISVFDSITTLLSEFKDYVSKPKLMYMLLKMMGLDPADIGTDEMKKLIDMIENNEIIPEKKGKKKDSELSDEELEDEEFADDELDDEEEELEEEYLDSEFKKRNKNWGR